MQLVGKLIIKSKNKIIEFLNEESTGRIASIDENGFPQIIPMNFVFLEDVEDRNEKVRALNGLMKKYQPEGGYLPMTSDMEVLEHTAVIKVIPKEMNGKYKIGQNMSKKDKIDIANKILERNSSTARETLEIMGFGIEEGKAVLKTDEVW